MGSCCESDNRKTKRIDDTAGGLVWVRRRNGSWWPGRILGLDELPESYAVSPRAGTPVKLLGREDGSMDWYNLEKSKRIKAFRCGEYDECIEKARASAVQSGRAGAKERKYARREDAILHALELEQTHYMQLKQELESTVNRRNRLVGSVGLGKEQGHSIKKVKHQSKSRAKLSQSKVQLEQKVNLNTVEVHVMQEERWKTTPTDSEDDGTEGAKRMRGLQELGLGVVSKRKLDLICAEGLHEPSFQGNTSLGESNMENGFSSMSTINSSKEPCTSLKKRTQTSQAHESLKRKNRRRQLTKVLESSATVEVPSICHEGVNSSQSSLQGATFNRTCISAPAETKKTDCSEVVNGSFGSSETSCVEASLDALEDPHNPVLDDTNFSSLKFVDDGFLDIPVVWKEIQTGDLCGGFASSAPRELQLGAVERQDGRYCEADLTEQDNNINVTSSFITHGNNTSQSIEKGTSKEDAKGKRNSMYEHSNGGPRKPFSGSFQAESCFPDKPVLDAEARVDNSPVDESPTSNYSGQQAKCGSVSNSIQGKSTTGAPKVNSSASMDCEGQASRSVEAIAQSDDMGDFFCSPPTYERRTETFLIRDLTHSLVAPRRSLSRCQTHPTSCSSCQVGDMAIRSSSSGPVLYDVKVEVKASYQGRHVPLISLMSKLNGKAIVGHPVTVAVLGDGYRKTNRHCRVASRSIDTRHGQEAQAKHKRHMVDSKLWDGGGMVVKLQRRSGCITKLQPDAQRKPLAQSMVRSLPGKKSSNIRKSGFLARKIRKLSSITVDCEHKEEKRKPVVEDPVRPVACVPLKLVFSRINEALSSPSRSENHA